MRPISTGQQWLTVSDSESFTRYLQEVRNYQPLDRKEELDAFTRYRAGERETQLKRIVCHNQRFVLSVAKRYHSSHGQLTLGDLVQAGNIGLLKAVDGYEPGLGFKFITYAVAWIRKYLVDEITRNEMTITRPQHHYIQQQRENGLRDRHEMLTGEILADEHIREQLIAAGHVYPGKGPLEARHCVVSLDEPRTDKHGAGDGNWDLHEYLPAASGADTASLERQAHLQQCTSQVLAELTPAQREILSLCYGLGGGEPMGHEYVAQHMRLSMPKLKVLKAKAMDCFKARLLTLTGCLEHELLDEFLCS